MVRASLAIFTVSRSSGAASQVHKWCRTLHKQQILCNERAASVHEKNHTDESKFEPAHWREDGMQTDFAGWCRPISVVVAAWQQSTENKTAKQIPSGHHHTYHCIHCMSEHAQATIYINLALTREIWANIFCAQLWRTNFLPAWHH